MKTVYEIVQEYIKVNTTPMRGFTVGDKVKTPPPWNLSGEIVKVLKNIVILDIEHEGNHEFKRVDEYWLMPDNDKTNAKLEELKNGM